MGDSGIRTAVLGLDSLLPVAVFHRVSVAGTNPVLIKATPSYLLGYRISNRTNGLLRKVVFHDQATPPVAGTNVYFPIDLLGQNPATVPETGLFIAAGIYIPFQNGLAITITGGLADNDATPVNANDVSVLLLYR